MIVGTHIKDDIRYAVEDMGFEWKIVTEQDVRARLTAAQDIDLLAGLDGSNEKRSEPDIAEPIINTECKIPSPGIFIKKLSSVPKTATYSPKMTTDDKYRIAFYDTKIGERFSRKQLEDKIMDKFPDGQTRGGILPTDRCYNIVNIGVSNPKIRIFEYKEKGEFIYLGESYPYTGYVTWKNEKCDEWQNGKLTQWKNWPSRK